MINQPLKALHLQHISFSLNSSFSDCDGGNGLKAEKGKLTFTPSYFCVGKDGSAGKIEEQVNQRQLVLLSFQGLRFSPFNRV